MTYFYQEFDVVEKIKVLDQAYAGETDKAGLPLWFHALRMAQSIFETEPIDQDLYDLINTALFHDYLEDAKINDKESVLKLHVNDKVFEAVKILTRKEDQQYMQYINSVIRSKNDLAIQVKKLDLIDHITYAKNITKGLLTRYQKAIVKFI